MKTSTGSLYGLKWNPFSPEAPTRAFLVTPAVEHFCWRVEHLASEGGFALLSGESGTGKSITLRILQERLSNLRDLKVCVLTRPQASLADFYREMGESFGVELRPHNRWNGAKALRACWETFIDTALFHPVLIVDEAQEVAASVLNELRFLSSAKLDSRCLLTIVLAGDGRLPERFRGKDLLPLGSRVRVRSVLGHLRPAELQQHLDHVIEQAGAPGLMTDGLKSTLCEHAAGNLRVLANMAGELLDAGLQRDGAPLDEELYFETFSSAPRTAQTPRKGAAGRRRE